MAASKGGAILVTGGNKGIGLALIKHLLSKQPEDLIFLGSRDLARGEAAKASLESEEAKSRVHVVQLDVSSDESVSQAANQIQALLTTQQRRLWALVNNAGVYYAAQYGEPPSLRGVLEVNVWGLKRVSETFIPLLQHQNAEKTKGRVVNVTSAAGAMGITAMNSEERKRVFCKPAHWGEVEAALADALAIDEKEGYDEDPEIRKKQKADAYEAAGFGSGIKDYYLSKAAANALTILHAKQYPEVVINALTPGYVATDMTLPFLKDGKTPQDAGMKLPHEAMVPFDVTLFAEIGTGRYFGSDGKRSPIDRYRSPGDPEYTSDSD